MTKRKIGQIPVPDKLLNKLNGKYVEMASSPDEECVICVNAKAVMQTYPCGHKVVCRRCFVKTIQIALSQRTLPLRCVICRAKILRLRQTQPTRLQPSHTFRSRSSSGTMSKNLSQNTGCSFKGNPWPGGSKHSKSLPGINGGSFKYRSSVNRSYSTVVYRNSSSFMRRCCRSCSLESYTWTPIHDTQSVNLKQDKIDSDDRSTSSHEMKDKSLSRQKQSSSLSRDKLIHQFQRDFHEGQLTSTRLQPPKINTNIKSPSSTLATSRERKPAVSVVEFMTKSEHHSNMDHKHRTIESNATTRDTKNQDEEESTPLKKTKQHKSLRLEKKDKLPKCPKENTKGNMRKKKVKKDKRAEKKTSKSKHQ